MLLGKQAAAWHPGLLSVILYAGKVQTPSLISFKAKSDELNPG